MAAEEEKFRATPGQRKEQWAEQTLKEATARSRQEEIEGQRPDTRAD